MQHYYFNVTDGRRTYPDPLGVSLEGLSAARIYAHNDARALLESWMIQSAAPWRIEVVDSSGQIVITIALPEAAVSETCPLFCEAEDLAA